MAKLTEYQLARAKDVLPRMFPAVLAGECPLPIFADALDDHDLPYEAEWIRRLHVKYVHNVLDRSIAPTGSIWLLALYSGSGTGWYSIIKPKNNPDNVDERIKPYTFDTEQKANKACWITAVVNVRMALLAGQSLPTRTIPNFDTEMAKRELEPDFLYDEVIR